ncbi:MAG: hypothetical protein RL555_65 [Bacteroidota bacterium]|jgi:hypothetical protein
MNKAVGFALLYISLFIVEILIVFMSLVLVVLFQHGFDLFFIKGAWRDTGLWNFWRVLFYGLPFVILYFILFKYFDNIKLYKPLLLSLFNLSVYFTLSVLSRVIWGKNVPLPPAGIMFWITCIAIFLSPLILGQILYFKKLMESL